MLKYEGTYSHEKFYFLSIQLDEVNKENLDFFVFQTINDDYWDVQAYENPYEPPSKTHNYGNLPSDIQSGFNFSYNGNLKSHYTHYDYFNPIQFRLLPNSC